MIEVSRTCPDCGADISDRHPSARRCRPCADAHAKPWDRVDAKRTEYGRVCARADCGVEFRTRTKKQRYCSGRCSGIDSHQPPTTRTCLACASSYLGRVDHCSRRCYDWIRKNPGTRIPTACGWCGGLIVGRSTRARFCNRNCAAMTMISRRRARKNGKPVHRINPVDIFERDGWVCHICTESIDRTQSGQQPLAPALDHLIPVAHPAYPGHVATNVAAAHWGCNTAKGARMTDADLTLHLLLMADMTPGEPMKRRPWSTAGVQTHCLNGHEFTEENTYWRPDGHGRQCRACIKLRARKKYLREDRSKRDARIAALRASRPKSRPMTRNRVIRAWARSQGMDVKVKARIPGPIAQAFEKIATAA